MEYNNGHSLGKPVLLITKNAVHDMLRTRRIRQSKLHECVKEVIKCYSSSSLSNGDGDTDFDDPMYQVCYVFLYFPALCLGTFHGLSKCQGHLGAVLERASQKNCLKVCALGGGPGTDLFGVRMFLNDIGYNNVPIKATILDRHPKWSLAFQCLLSNLDQQPSRLSAEYFHLEVGSKVVPVHLNAVADVDLVTCSKFISTIRVLHNAKLTLIEILRRVKLGAYIFYVDNSRGGNTDFFRSIAKLANFTEVAYFERGADNQFQLPNTEHPRILRDLSGSDWFNYNSQRTLRVTFMLWRKNDQVTKSKLTSMHNREEATLRNKSFVDSTHELLTKSNSQFSSQQHVIRRSGRSEQHSVEQNFRTMTPELSESYYNVNTSYLENTKPFRSMQAASSRLKTTPAPRCSNSPNSILDSSLRLPTESNTPSIENKSLCHVTKMRAHSSQTKFPIASLSLQPTHLFIEPYDTSSTNRSDTAWQSMKDSFKSIDNVIRPSDPLERQAVTLSSEHTWSFNQPYHKTYGYVTSSNQSDDGPAWNDFDSLENQRVSSDAFDKRCACCILL